LLKVADTEATLPGVSGNDYLFDNALSEAVKRFQRRHGLLEDGVVGGRTLAALNVPVSERVRQIELNLERLRGLPESLGQRYILVNIPDFRMRVVEGDENVLDAEVIVGQPKRPTPVFSGNMSYLVMSPRWHVPYSIAVKDKLPLLRRDPYALYRQGIHIFAANGREVNPGMINWHGVSRRNFPFHLRQEPGSRNALGRIKFIFPNPHQVYLHDTPQTHLFGRSERAFSSGCVRVSKPVELAEYLLKQDPGWSRKKIVSVSEGKHERHVNLPESIPIHLLYWTAWVSEDGVVNFRRDIYGHDKGLAKVLFAG
jgi:murein L,D-transpeptidase YcbB/YkuD